MCFAETSLNSVRPLVPIRYNLTRTMMPSRRLQSLMIRPIMIINIAISCNLLVMCSDDMQYAKGT